MEPQGFLGGLGAGLVQSVLNQKKKQEDEFHELKKNRAQQLSVLADKIRPEDLPMLMQGLDGILNAKKPEQADAAYGSIMAKIIQERYDLEQQSIASNQQSDITAQNNANLPAQEEIGTTGYAPTNTIGGSVSNPAVTINQTNQDAKPVKLNPTKYSEGKIRIKTEEGEMGRAVKLYSQKEAALYKEKSAYEEKRQDEIRETNRQKIEAAAANANEQILARGEDENGNAVIVTRNRSTGEQKVTPLPGVQWPASVTAKEKIEAQKLIADNKLKAHAEEWKAKLQETQRMNTQKIKESESRIKEVEDKIAKGYYDKSGSKNKANTIIGKYKTTMAPIMVELRGVQSEINRIMGINPALMDEAEKEKQITPLRQKQANLEYQLDVSSRMLETELGQLDEAEKSSGSGGKVKVTGTSSTSTPSSTPSSSKPSLKVGDIRSSLGLPK